MPGFQYLFPLAVDTSYLAVWRDVIVKIQPFRSLCSVGHAIHPRNHLHHLQTALGCGEMAAVYAHARCTRLCAGREGQAAYGPGLLQRFEPAEHTVKDCMECLDWSNAGYSTHI